MKRRKFFLASLVSFVPFLKADDGDNVEKLERKVVDAALAWAGPFAVGTAQQRSDATVALLDAVNALRAAESPKGGKHND